MNYLGQTENTGRGQASRNCIISVTKNSSKRGRPTCKEEPENRGTGISKLDLQPDLKEEAHQLKRKRLEIAKAQMG